MDEGEEVVGFGVGGSEGRFRFIGAALGCCKSKLFAIYIINISR